MPCASPGKKSEKTTFSAISEPDQDRDPGISAVNDYGSGFQSSDRVHGVCGAMYPIGGPEMGQELAAPASTGYSSSGHKRLLYLFAIVASNCINDLAS